ncbi:MAG: DNA helicase, partial [Candidatus Pacebacteria bacterium]|nr:DNA helicase [Candidatus Paceibacterota bacterium]
ILIKEVHEDFNIVEHVDDGVVYIHGQLPELIKEYLEYKFREVKEIKYIIANTVILEGVNFPIDSLFIFGSHIISNGKSLMNLVGRVNRLNEIFKFSKKNVELLENNLYKLLPKVHIINEKEQKEDQHDSKFKHLRSRVFPDVIKNPTLELFDIKKVGPKGTTKEKQEERERFVKRTEKIQAYEKFISNIIDTHRDEVKKYFIENSLNNYYIDTELAIDSFIDTKASILSSDNSEWRLLSMMDKIEKVFIQNPDNIFEYEFKRLQNESARKYYEGYITIAKKKNLKNNIKWQVDKFIEIKNNEELKKLDQQKIYVGESYGDTIWKTENWRDSKREVYAELSNKEGSTLTNLAIVKLQVEENFVSFTLNTFIQALFDFKLISENEYNVYVYGTKNVEKIKLSKQGLSLSLISRLEDDEQLGNLSFENGNIVGNDAFKSFLNSNLVNDFYRFEIQRYIIVNNNQRNGEEMGISTIK